MRYRQPILRLASILLIFVLTQKMVGGLYLHNWLHSSRNITHQFPVEKAFSQYNCSCIDDFYNPFTEPAAVFVETPAINRNVFFAVPEISLPAIAKIFHSLRGPPVS